MFEMMLNGSTNAVVGDLPTYDELSQILGFSDGILRAEAGWLTRVIDDKVMYVSKTPVRYRVSYYKLIESNLISGNRTFEYQGHLFKIRLPFGTNGSIAESAAAIAGSEWNRLFYPLVNSPTGTSSDGIVFGSVAKYDPVTELGIASSQGGASYCMDTGNNLPFVTRGWIDVTHIHIRDDGTLDNGRGWRPVLELV